MAVTDFTAGDLPPLFTSSVANSTTTPDLTFDLSDASPYTVFGNNTNANASPAFFIPTLASALFANQGTATTVLHGNASGNPSWSAINLANDVSGTLAIANGGTGSTVGAILNQTASSQTAGFSISGNGTLGGTLAVSTKVNIGSPSGTTGALNTNQDGIWSFRNSDASRYIRFNTAGTFNDFLSTGVALVINYGFAVAAQNVNFFGGSAAHLGILSIGSNAATNARLNVKGSTANSSAYSLRLFDSSDVEKFSVRNDGQIAMASLTNGIVKSTSGVLSNAVAGTDYLTPSSLSATSPILYNSSTGVISSQPASASDAGYITTGSQTFAGAKTFAQDVVISGTGQQFKVKIPNSSVGGLTLANAAGTHQWTFETDPTSIGNQGELRIFNQLTVSSAIAISTTNNVTLVGTLTGTSAIFSGNITATTSSLGTVTAGVWNGTAISDTYIASASTWNSKESALTFSTGLTRTVNTITINQGFSPYWTGQHQFAQFSVFEGIYIGKGNNSVSGNMAVGEACLGGTSGGSVSGSANVAVGVTVLNNVTTGSHNTGLGHHTLTLNTTGLMNVGIGSSALYANTTGFYNTAIGTMALMDSNGNGNTAVGLYSLLKNTTGSWNISIGANTMEYNETGSNNLAIGNFCLNKLDASGYNTSIGHYSSTHLTSGEGNIVIGNSAGTQTSAYANATSMDWSILIGNPRINANGETNQIVIGVENVAGKGSNTTSIGSASTSLTYLYGDLTISGSNATKASGTAWINPSDIRLKTNIKSYDKGLSELMQIVPKVWNFNNVSGYNTEKVHVGLIAQEVKDILPEMVNKFEGRLGHEITELLAIDASEITWLLVKSVQELKVINEGLQNRVRLLESQI